ncbi:hypothetical protein HB662_26940 [Roseomonas frigidaquae]|uniref:Uncharacterized protein n=1 Tax=Falsiroseomonas frigidaquae TaxID=487318 RepID=A0ABX1F7S7_9PROT|nr:hypothetical protein [Falsiroseomonas frigidaquae]NKE48438.1 hypothetical protein [Falsiroseomonas frigidaquae]
MMPPPHLQPILALRALGCDLHLVVHGRAVPPHRAGHPALLVLGDDPEAAAGGTRGPAAFDCADLRAWFAAMRVGAPLGVFTGAPDAGAYAALCAATAASPAGGIIVECGATSYQPWADFAAVHAPDALRLDVVTASIRRAAMRCALAAGRQPVFMR